MGIRWELGRRKDGTERDEIVDLIGFDLKNNGLIGVKFMAKLLRQALDSV